MQQVKILVLTVIMLGTTACIDAAPRDRTPRIPESQRLISTWIGKPVSRMITRLGAPTKTFAIAGKEYLVYEYTGTRSGGSQRYGSAYSYSYVGCTWTWEIRNGIIVGGNAVGPGCND